MTDVQDGNWISKSITWAAGLVSALLLFLITESIKTSQQSINDTISALYTVQQDLKTEHAQSIATEQKLELILSRVEHLRDSRVTRHETDLMVKEIEQLEYRLNTLEKSIINSKQSEGD